MNEDLVYYVGLDIHKRIIASCVKAPDGSVLEERTFPASRAALCQWAGSIGRPWIGAMEATLFTGWIYDALEPYALDLKVGNPLLMRAIGASKKKNDRVDASKIADMVRCDLLPECYMAPTWVRELRQVLRYRNFLVRLAVSTKNKTAGLLMERGVEYNKKRLHGRAYFAELMENLGDVPDSFRDMLGFNHEAIRLLERTSQRLMKELECHPALCRRVELLRTIRGVGQVMALTWALEISEVERFPSAARAMSYCGLTSREDESAGKRKRGPISKQRNKHLQWTLIETAKLAPRWNPQLATVYERECARGNKNQATIAVARKLVRYLLAVDRSGEPFVPRPVEAEK